jgi:hypothetical protein
MILINKEEINYNLNKEKNLFHLSERKKDINHQRILNLDKIIHDNHHIRIEIQFHQLNNKELLIENNQALLNKLKFN